MRNKKGITLIALVITIVVILILAGVTITIAINGNFFDKANNVKNRYGDAVTVAEQQENEANKQNYRDFDVDDEFVTKGIKIYGQYKGKTYIEEINMSLSQFIQENKNNEENVDLYFMADTDRTSVKFTINGGTNNFNYCTYSNITDDQNKNYYGYSVEDVSGEEKTKLIRKSVSSVNDLNGLEVAILNSNDENICKLNFAYGNHTTADSIYVPTGKTSYYGEYSGKDSANNLDNNNSSNKWSTIKKENSSISDKTSLTYIPETFQKDTTDTTKGDFQANRYADLQTSKSKNSIELIARNTSIIQHNKGKVETNPDYDKMTLYLVQEQIQEDKITTTMYLDDYDLKFYNPIETVTVNNKFIPLQLEKNEQIEYSYGKADINCDSTMIKLTEIPSDLENSFSLFDGDRNENGGKEKTGANITIGNPSNPIYPEIDDAYFSRIKVQVTLTDLGGQTKTGEGYINIGDGNFYIYVPENETEEEDGKKNTYKKTLDEAIGYAKTLKTNTRKDPTIEQNINEFSYENDLTIDNDLNNLTFDMHGNTLSFANDKHLTIDSGVTFNLVSSNDNKLNNYSDCYEYKGNINFNHDTTFRNESVVKYISNEDFLAKYPQFKNVGTYLESGGIPGASNTLWNRIKYTGLFTTRKIEAYKEYIHSFNAIGFNVDYKREESGIINNGTLNFYSGKIVINTDERVMAIGAFGGGAVLNISNGFLDILRACGVEIADLTDLTASYSQLENTASAIENHGTVILGEANDYTQTVDGKTYTGIASAEKAHPEIEVNVMSKEHAYGVSVGNYRHPNKVISQAYGIRNVESNSKVEMNSGFMVMFLTNKTNSWWSAVSIGKSYGIYNEKKGQVNIKGITEKKADMGSISIYQVIVDKIFKQYEDDKEKNVLEEALEAFDKGWKQLVETKTFYGFFTHSNLQLVSKLTGATYYTNSYAVAYPEKGTNKNITINSDIIKYVQEKTKIDYPLKSAYWGYHNNTYQSIQNFLNHYLNFDTINGNAFSSAVNKFNNVLNTDWIGEDMNADGVLDYAIKKIVRLFK